MIIFFDLNIGPIIFPIKEPKFDASRYPTIWNKDLLKFHNVCITSSVVVDKDILINNNCIVNQKMGHEDYNIWLKVLQHTDCAFVDVPCLYYDNNHGYGQKWH